MKITKQDFEEWREHPVTKAVFAAVEDDVFRIRQAIGDGACWTESAERTQMLSDRNHGEIRGLQRLLRIEFGEDDESE